MHTVRLGIIGLSRRSGIFQESLPANAKIVAVADPDQEKLDGFGSDLFKTPDYQEMLSRSDVDAVCIMTRDPLHAEMTIAALEARKPVFLEKPMAITIKDCDNILETAARTQTRLFTGHNMRYMPFVQKMKDIIDSGVIGEIQAVWCRHFISYGSCYFRSWCSDRQQTTGLLLQKGAHDLDVIQWLSGGYAQRVVGMGKLSVYDQCGRRSPQDSPDRDKAFQENCWPPLSNNDLAPVIDIEDHTMLMLSLDNNVQATYTQCFYTPDSERNYTFIGTKGRLENIGDEGDCAVHVWTKRGSRQKPDIIYTIAPIEGSHGGSDPEMLKTFIDFVNGEDDSRNSPLSTRYAVAAGVMGHESMRNGNIPLDVPTFAAKGQNG